MKKVVLLCALFVGLLGVLYFVQRRREKMTSVILSRYPRNGDFVYVVDSHFNRRSAWFLRTSSPLVLTTDFDNGFVGGVRWYDVDAKGVSFGYQEKGPFSEQKWPLYPPYSVDSRAYLKGAQLSQLRVLLKQMPENAPPLSPADLVLVSFDDGRAWRTQVYDKTALPAPVKQLLALLGRRRVPS